MDAQLIGQIWYQQPAEMAIGGETGGGWYIRVTGGSPDAAGLLGHDVLVLGYPLIHLLSGQNVSILGSLRQVGVENRRLAVEVKSCSPVAPAHHPQAPNMGPQGAGERIYPAVKFTGNYGLFCSQYQEFVRYNLTRQAAHQEAWAAFGMCGHQITYFDENGQVVMQER